MIKWLLFLIVFRLQAYAYELKVGDVLLQPLHCFSCSLIEAQTKSPYSHIGIVIKIKNDQVFVAEAFHKVQVLKLSDFANKTQKGERIKIRRPLNVSPDLYTTDMANFDGLSYDAKFLWDNFDTKGEKIYCSELLHKLMFMSNMQVPQLKPMSFDIHRDHWVRYFQGEVPDGELGIAPADFDDDNLYTLIGFL